MVQCLHPPEKFENPTIILKSYIKENYDSNKTYRYVHDLSLLNFIHQQFMSCLQKSMWILNFNQPLNSYFWFLTEVVLLKAVHPQNISQHTKFMAPHWLVKVLHPPRKFQRLQFWNSWSYELKIIASRPSSMAWTPYYISYKSTNWFKSWLGETCTHTDRIVIS
jgi:hypothetical protein